MQVWLSLSGDGNTVEFQPYLISGPKQIFLDLRREMVQPGSWDHWTN